MCLTIRNIQVVHPDTVKPTKKQTYYKRYTVQSSKKGLKVTPPYRTSQTFVVRPGDVITSNRKSSIVTSNELSSKNIHEGIHCYTTLQSAKNALCGNEVILKVSCEPNDFVAKSGVYNEVVCHRVTVEDIMQACSPVGKSRYKYVTKKVTKDSKLGRAFRRRK